MKRIAVYSGVAIALFLSLVISETISNDEPFSIVDFGTDLFEMALLALAIVFTTYSAQEIREGRIEIVPRAVGSADGGVVSADGTQVPADAIIWATGYRPDFSWIDGHAGIPRDARGVPPRTLIELRDIHVLTGRFLYAVVRQAGEVARVMRRSTR